jgi:hypothetical protein
MFGMLKNLTKAVVAVAITPVDAVVDVLTIPESSCDPHRGTFDRTAKRLQQASDALDEAVKPEKDAP